jgi:hypothetical protein
MSHVFGWSTLTLDDIDGHLQIGGPCVYGGAALNGLSARFGLIYKQAINMASCDKNHLPNLLQNHAIVFSIPQSVRFEITQGEGHRIVRLTSNSFRIDGEAADTFNEYLNTSVIILSPVIGEFGRDLYFAVSHAACETVFVDPFNNDDGLLSPWDMEVLMFIVQDLVRTKNVFLKLSEPEYRAVIEYLPSPLTNGKLKLLVTKGASGADLISGDHTIHASGIQVNAKAELGAGDIFMYSFAGLYALGQPVDTCLLEANRIAAHAVTVPKWEELLHVVST